MLAAKSSTALLIAVLISTAGAESFFLPDYSDQSAFLPTTPGVEGGAAGAMFNPALWGMVAGPELGYYSSDISSEDELPLNRTFILGGKGFGFSTQYWDYPVAGTTQRRKLYDYSIGFGGGDKSLAFGAAYGWSKGDISASTPRDNTLSIGIVSRPDRRLSVGIAGAIATGERDARATIDVGVRPLGTPLVTLFGEAGIQNDQSISDAVWTAGAAIKPLPGIIIHGKVIHGREYRTGLSLSLGRVRISTQPHYDRDGNQTRSTYGIRLGFPEKNLVTPITQKSKNILKLELDAPLKYQRYKIFDERGHTLLGLLNTLDDAQGDERVTGVALNITEDFYGSWEMIWEVREKLGELKRAGKHVTVFLERGSMRLYYLASAADKIMVDPLAMIELTGFNMGRTFYRNMLEKLGIGFYEWRFFTYKSAMESFSRNEMSQADKEQRAALIEDFYRIMREDICRDRQITHDEFDRIVDELGILPADSLIAHHLADSIGRWDEAKGYVKSIVGKDKSFVGEGAFRAMQYVSDEWGIPPRIAVIYALGPCAMNTGINARRLQKVIKRARDDNRIRAVVFRADSPGGDAMPSDIVALELKKTAEEKPVIVSQGWVAASGGYWISMYGDTIVASPWTITGSIGVIGGWFYNEGFGDKLGLSYDHTQVGKHADLGGGVALPLIGAQLPNRNLDDEERAAAERMMRAMYGELIKKVGAGRDMTAEKVDEIGQGRVWSGGRGKEIGLVDELGGMEVSIAIARAAAGIKPDRSIEVVERPELGLINPDIFQPKMFGSKTRFRWGERETAEWDYLRMLLEAEGRPLLMLPPDVYAD